MYVNRDGCLQARKGGIFEKKENSVVDCLEVYHMDKILEYEREGKEVRR